MRTLKGKADVAERTTAFTAAALGGLRERETEQAGPVGTMCDALAWCESGQEEDGAGVAVLQL